MHIKYEEYYSGLLGGEYKEECDMYILKSINHEMCLQKLSKKSFSIFDVKKNCLKNINNLPRK